MENKKQQSKIFYGWVIVVGCMLVQAVPYALAANIQSSFTSYVTEAEGFTYTQFSLIFTIGTLVSALCAPFIGKLFASPKANVKLLYVLGVILVGVGFSSMSLAGGNIYAYYALSILVQIGSAIVSAIGVPTLINSWFTENKGIAMGLAFSGGGIGNMILQQFAGRWLTNPAIGYKGAYFRFGLLAIIVSLPVALFIMRFPKSKAELELNKPKKAKKDTSTTQNSNWGYSFAEVSKMKYFWIFALSFIFVGLYVGGMAVQFIPYFQTLEKAQLFTLGSALVASAFGFFSIFGNLCGGVLFDKLGIRKALLLSGSLVITSGLSLIFAAQINALGFVFAVCLGVSMFSYVIGPAYMSGALFGNREFGTILGVVQIFFAIGFGSGSTIFGIIVDNAGFTTGWISTIVYAVIAYAGLLYSTSSIIKMNKVNNVVETKKIS